MIVEKVKLIRARDLAIYAWSRISKFQNVSYTKEQIINLHSLPKEHWSNAQKQAEEIKHCLLQAKEYFDAAGAVSLATKPVLLYYSVMSMALSEILLKQTADSRLQKLRAEHNCHGLQLSYGQRACVDHTLNEATSHLSAKMQYDSEGNPRGTFEVWRRSAREYPVAGVSTTIFNAKASLRGFGGIFMPADIPLQQLKEKGISLLDCIRQLPCMSDLLEGFGIPLNMVRATISVGGVRNFV
jgi:hypothetical protein